MDEFIGKDRHDFTLDKPQVENREVENLEVGSREIGSREIDDRRTIITPVPTAPLDAEDIVQSGATARTIIAAAPTVVPAAAAAATAEERVQLFNPTEANELRARWDSVQVGFVDEPRRAVEDAEALVSSTMKRLTEIFAEERQKLNAQWEKRGEVSTEDLRVSLRRYRSFFNRLLSV